MFKEDNPSAREARGGREDVRSALFCMALLSRLTGQRLDSVTLVQRFGHLPRIDRNELVDAFNELGMRARAIRFRASSLGRLTLPAILELKDGRFALLQAVSDDHVQVHLPDESEVRRPHRRDLLKMTTGWAVVTGSGDDVAESMHPAGKPGLSWFLRWLFRYRAVMREVLLASVFVQLFALATPIVFMIVIDKVFAHNNLSTLDVLVFALIVVSLFEILLGGVRAYLVSHTGNRVDVELGRQLFRHLMALPLSYFDSRSSGDTIARIRELESVRGFMTGASLTLLIDLLFVVVFIAVMYLFSPMLAAIVLAALPLFFLVSLVVTPLMRHRLEDRHQRAAENQSFLVETLGAIETIKSNAMEPRHRHAFEEKLGAYARAASSGASLSNWINQLIGLSSKGLTIVLLYVGAKLVLSGELTVGQLIAFNMLSGRVIAPVQRLAQLWQELTSVRVSLRRLADITDAPVEIAPRIGSTRLPEIEGRIRFERVSFRYDADRPQVLTDVSFDIAPGELVAVLGATGAGKTTLAKLLQRLYTPDSGSITVDGVNLLSMDPAWLRRRIGVVAQDYVLFSRSIRDNITLGAPDIDDARVIETACLTGAHDIIAGLPGGYDTVLAERGRGLSAGQRQAIALTRALVTDPALLILDEATSAFDHETERRFRENLASMRLGRTTFVITHRETSVRDADHILRLEAGRLVEDRPGSTTVEAADPVDEAPTSKASGARVGTEFLHAAT